MLVVPDGSITGILISGGLDSSILLARLLDDGHEVQPFYVRSGVVWESAEMAAMRAELPLKLLPAAAAAAPPSDVDLVPPQRIEVLTPFPNLGDVSPEPK